MTAYFRFSLIIWLATVPLAAEEHGIVKFGGLPLPGAIVTAEHGEMKHVTRTNLQGLYSFPNLPDGVWVIQIEMLCFETIRKETSVAPDAPGQEFEMKMLQTDQIQDAARSLMMAPQPGSSPPGLAVGSPDVKQGALTTPTSSGSGFQRTDVNASAQTATTKSAPDAPENSGDLSQQASDGFLISGSANNGASSPFALSNAFGNNRRGPKSLYTGMIGFTLNNSTLDARSFSFTGQDNPKPAVNQFTGLATFGGPLNIPRLIRNGPNVFFAYQWVRNRVGTTTPALVPTLVQRQEPGTPQALDLLNLYPLPNFSGSGPYNYQVPIVAITHQDNVQSRVNEPIGRKDQITGNFSFQSTRTDNPSVLNFLDTSDITGLNATVNWRHIFTPRMFLTLGYRYSRLTTLVTPFFENRENVSGNAGISGNAQDPQNWGPPTLVFSSGIQSLTDTQASLQRNQTGALSSSMSWNRTPHNFSIGSDFRRQQFNALSQQNARGTFDFTGAATGSDFSDFLAGVPDAASIAFGPSDKYFRQNVYDVYANDDWRVSPQLTLNVGIRWDYESPMSELYGRLVNLDVAPGFVSVAPILASNPIGPLTGQKYPDSLLYPDKHAIVPRLGLAWRPVAGSSMVVHAGYGIYCNTSVYQNIATMMTEETKVFSIQNTPATPLSLASFNEPSNSSFPNFGIDPHFRVGYAQNWQASVQRDLPAALQMTVTYLGIKGTRGMQEFLPNTYPVGAANPCPTCPTGFIYMTSNGNSTRESGSIQLRRRLHSGFTSSLQYTLSKSIDDAALGGRGQATPLVAQNWLDLSAERGLSSFDQRQLLNVTAQYTSGMGVGGGTLINGWKGGLFKEWTISTTITAGSGLPFTPTYFAPTPGTAYIGYLRPDVTGAAPYAAPAGLLLNPAAFATPTPGQWGNAGRDSVTGPAQFTLNGSLGRTFRWGDRINVDLRFDATNALNHVTFTGLNTIVNSPQFGSPNLANQMRSVQTTLRWRF